MITFPFSVLNILEILFPSTVSEWNNLDLKMRNSETCSTFKKNICKFIRPSSNSIFNCHSPNGMKLIARLRLGLVTSVSTNLGTTFRTLLIQFAAMEMTSRLLFLLVCFLSLKESTYETRKNVFYYNSKALFVEIIKFKLFRYSNTMTSSNAQI